jgi:hypothetical protein
MEDMGRVLPMRELVGPSATASWLTARGIRAPERWTITIGLYDDARAPTCDLQIVIDAREWGFCLSRANKLSFIRVLDAPRIQTRDDFDLLRRTPSLRDLAKLVQWIEDSFDVRFRRAHATIKTTLANAEDRIRLWVVASL